MSNKYIYLVLFLLVIPAISAAGAFEVYKGQDPGALCPGTTGLFTDVVTNEGTETMQFTISGSGSASAISTFVPMGFSLNPGQSKTIYTYVTPRTSTQIGNYNLNLVVSSNGQSKTLGHEITVKNCFEFSLQALDSVKHVCPCESDKFDITINNQGDYAQTYDFTVEGEATDSVTLSQDRISVGAGEQELIYAYIKSECDDLGEYGFTIIADPEIGNILQSIYATLVVDPCYDFDVQTDQDYLEFCEHTQKVIPIQINNQGSTKNIYYLEVSGPDWANLESNKIEVASGGSGRVNLILSPDYGVEGDFDVSFSAVTDKGDLEVANVFNIKVNKCHAVDVSIEKKSDKICNSLENTYEVKIENTGTTEKTYDLELLAPDWVKLESGEVTLESGEEQVLTLTVSPGYDVVSATYQIKVKATAKDSDSLFGEDILSITSVAVGECYQAQIGINEKSIEVHYDGTATVPIVIENKGTNKASYDLGVSGTASSFVYLNPAAIEIEPDKAEVVYLYIAPNAQIADGDYEASISVRLGDSTILASDNVKITVLESKATTQEDLITGDTVVETGGVSFWDRVKFFFADLFTQEPKEEPLEGDIPEIEFEEVVEEETEEEVVEEVVEEEPVEEVVEEEPVEEVVEEETLLEMLNLDELISGSHLFSGEGDSFGFLVNGEEHTATLQTKGEDYIVLEIRSELKSLILDVGESRFLDTDGDNEPDTKVTFNGYIDGEADITFEKIEPPAVVEETTEEEPEEEPEEEVVEEEPVEEVVEEETTEETTPTGSVVEGDTGDSEVSSFILAYKNYIIAVLVILILILLAVKTNLHKKVVDFFEEEIEEDEVFETKTDESKREEDKKFMEETAKKHEEAEKKVKTKKKVTRKTKK